MCAQKKCSRQRYGTEGTLLKQCDTVIQHFLSYSIYVHGNSRLTHSGCTIRIQARSNNTVLIFVGPWLCLPFSILGVISLKRPLPSPLLSSAFDDVYIVNSTLACCNVHIPNSVSGADSLRTSHTFVKVVGMCTECVQMIMYMLAILNESLTRRGKLL